MRRFLSGCFIGASILMLTSAMASAPATAEFNGRATDESGAVLPRVTVTATQTDTAGFTRPAIRLEAFNLLNNFNWDNPVTNFHAATFSRIQSQTGDSRILQFGVNYGF